MTDLLPLLNKSKISIKEFTRQLAPFMSIEWNDSWYQHIYRVVKGEVDPTLEEKSAINAWIKSFEQPHIAGAIAHRVSQVEASIALVRRYMNTGVYNRQEVERLFKKINSAIRI